MFKNWSSGGFRVLRVLYTIWKLLKRFIKIDYHLLKFIYIYIHDYSKHRIRSRRSNHLFCISRYNWRARIVVAWSQRVIRFHRPTIDRGRKEMECREERSPPPEWQSARCSRWESPDVTVVRTASRLMRVMRIRSGHSFELRKRLTRL